VRIDEAAYLVAKLLDLGVQIQFHGRVGPIANWVTAPPNSGDRREKYGPISFCSDYSTYMRSAGFNKRVSQWQ
jgi:hypothetical protein